MWNGSGRNPDYLPDDVIGNIIAYGAITPGSTPGLGLILG